MSYFLWGCRGILTLITLRSERASHHSDPESTHCPVYPPLPLTGELWRVAWKHSHFIFAREGRGRNKFKSIPRGVRKSLTLSLLSSKSVFNQISKSNCTSDVARICSIITFHLSKLCKVKFSILRECHISCEVAGEFWHWSLSGVKGLNTFIIWRGWVLEAHNSIVKCRAR